MDVGRVAKFALGGTVALGTVALLAACGAEARDDDAPIPTEPDGGIGSTPPRNLGPTTTHPVRQPKPKPQQSAADFVQAQFKRFDANHAGGITKGELTHTARGAAIYGPDILTSTDRAGGEHYKYRIGHRRLTESMKDAFAAANRIGTKDGRATWGELTRLAARFDTDGRAGLSTTEQSAFTHKWGVDVIKREQVWDGWETWVQEPPRHHPAPAPDPYPTAPGGGTSHGDDGPSYPSTPGTGTSHGDDSPSIPSGGTSHGDDGPSGPGSGTSHGDDGPGWPSSPGGTAGGDDGGTNAPGGNGNSSDNGNPGEGDF